MTAPTTTVVHRPEQARFTAEVDGVTGYLTYEVASDTVAMTHTIVPPAIGGRGVAAELTRTAVAWARERDLRIEPDCSYVRAWLAKNPAA